MNLSDLSEELQIELGKFIDECDSSGLIFVCKRKETKEGREYIMVRLYEIMEKNPTWKPSECLAAIEIQLNDEAYY